MQDFARVRVERGDTLASNQHHLRDAKVLDHPAAQAITLQPSISHVAASVNSVVESAASRAAANLRAVLSLDISQLILEISADR
ncbi:hypothetical protein ACFXG4_40430 [Nocardia sp. NPDC059246]|uniref:hypothetical protein n=1 Tax=unclassified Nocardia TaxID=2637762 RepID=UPI0036A0CF2A